MSMNNRDLEELRERIYSEEKEFQAGVGLSRNWDPETAGEEVIVSALEKLNKKPKFVLLFSTIHYNKKRNGMKKFVKAAYDALPKGTPMIGGTVAGFMNNYGCYTRGATAMAVYYPNMDVAVGVGYNTKRAPHLAAKECTGMIKEGLKESKYSNKLVIPFISGPIMPRFPLLGSKNMVSSSTFGELLTQLLQVSYLMGTGVSREEEVLDGLDTLVTDKYLIGSALMDDAQYFSNYQFYNNKLLTNSLVLLVIATDITFHLESAHGLHPTGLRFKITESKYKGKVLSKLDDMPATDRLFSSLGWLLKNDKGVSGIEQLHRRLYYYPLGFKKYDRYYPLSIGAILGKNILVGSSIDAREVEILTASGKDLLNAVDSALTKVLYNGLLMYFVVDCAIRLNTLGEKVYIVHKKLVDSFGDVPFLLICGSGENIHKPNGTMCHYNMSFNVLTFNR